MRAGVVIDAAATVDRLRDRVTAIERWGLHLVWLRQGDALPAPMLQAAATGAVTRAVRVGVEVEVGDVHPLHVAEEAAVADVATGGRLVLGLRAAAGAGADLEEAVRLVQAAHTSRPFRHPGPRWPTPANLPGNTFNVEDRVRVTPAPVQLELPTWVVGEPAVARVVGLPWLAPDLESGAVHGSSSAPGPAAPRPVEVDLSDADDERDHHAVVDELDRARRAWGCDLALFRLPDEEAAWVRAVERVARLVLPRLQLDRLPDGLADHWDATHA